MVIITILRADSRRVPESRLHTALEAALNCDVPRWLALDLRDVALARLVDGVKAPLQWSLCNTERPLVDTLIAGRDAVVTRDVLRGNTARLPGLAN